MIMGCSTALYSGRAGDVFCLLGAVSRPAIAHGQRAWRLLDVNSDRDSKHAILRLWFVTDAFLFPVAVRRGVATGGISVYIPPKISNRFVHVWDINTFWNCND